MKNKLPQYYVIKKDESNPLWEKYIKWLKNKSGEEWAGDCYEYYGFDGNFIGNGINACDSISRFNNITTLISLEFWESCVNPKPETNIPDGCKPFDLNRCIAGDEVVTRDGRPYKFGAYNPDAVDGQRLSGWIDKMVKGHYDNGCYISYKSNNDLFMKKKDVVTVEYAVITLEGISNRFRILEAAMDSNQKYRVSVAKFTITNGILTAETVHTF